MMNHLFETDVPLMLGTVVYPIEIGIVDAAVDAHASWRYGKFTPNQRGT